MTTNKSQQDMQAQHNKGSQVRIMRKIKAVLLDTSKWPCKQGPWGQHWAQDQGGPHVGPMNFAICEFLPLIQTWWHDGIYM